ncbi:bifunctional tetrahydrofolate synthase/dihydrofolate synthase [Gilliamella apis]|uniref:Dihydrofolate synthase/folylpolyglutamate synthase n=1 Tax=Gilliamella apis TaxID=1970738 RepID=A0A2C9XWE0_9GAMM|nr:bifunctional tetrahydrofolate synthase/dihydrofolate synthase [Gilliamella apis]OTQ34096.1 bifunctional tetrahydrofolate synthase/dihydrofolate synthase [Gilliamella apis]OTQ34856.1 bifunctional tetrahydrofolate synthase/dihydrofolate synthase [Gilliamella apis]OTQ38979.1 bifunctional tetrahydrofolate synthase/dihydrofolate synthase [Gilliamella apis]OTQ42557.1 bifunctional tetrahydrofolate synthase/dihydrofolate synthase [Gilliamella apis]OTQ45406.1 bifunctional tetrahydrofolate synthase/d
MQNKIPDAMSDLKTWLCYLEQLHPSSIELGLERVKSVAERLDLLQPAPYIFTVAGTNGKGTTCRTLEMILLAADKRVGVYSSPHLLHFTERVRINNQESTPSDTVKAFVAIEKARGDVSLTYFEYATLAALYQFKQAQLDVVILEVGLGGRLDATNIVDADIAIITTIGIDHVEYLGNTRESIGREKAGIFKPKSIAVVGEPEIPSSILDVAHAVNCSLFAVNKDWSYQQIDKLTWQFNSSIKQYQNLPIPQVPLANAATAIAALSYSPFSITQKQIDSALEKTSLIGRFQIIQASPTVIVDVAHNPHAASYLVKQIELLKQQQSTVGKVRFVIGMLKDKDIKSTLSIFNADQWYCASLYGERGCNADILKQFLQEENVENIATFDSVNEAYQKAMKEAKEDDIIVVCGSFHTVSAVLDIVGN